MITFKHDGREYTRFKILLNSQAFQALCIPAGALANASYVHAIMGKLWPGSPPVTFIPVRETQNRMKKVRCFGNAPIKIDSDFLAKQFGERNILALQRKINFGP
jgi:hypothetical protein